MYQKIQKICKEKGVSVNRLEKDLGFTRGSLYKWMEHTPSINKVKAVADYFGIAVDELVKN